MNSWVLDAHALIWHVEGNPRLGSQARAALQDPGSRLFIPAIALAEACYVVDRGRVKISSSADRLRAIDADPRTVIVPLDRTVIMRGLPLTAVTELHDRQIVATALLLIDQGQTVALLTRDANITASGLVPVIW